MNYNPKEQFKKLKNIDPDKDFVLKSRNRILSSKISVPWYIVFQKNPIFSGAFVFGLILLIFAGVLAFHKNQSLYSLNNTDDINKEFQNLTINIELKEITYQNHADQLIASAIDEITDTKIKHLNQEIIEKENNSLNNETNGDVEIEKMLNSIIF